MDVFLYYLALSQKRQKAATGDKNIELQRQRHRLLEFSLEVTTVMPWPKIGTGRATSPRLASRSPGRMFARPKLIKNLSGAMPKKMVEQLKTQDILLAYHICGDATAIVPDMVETGAAVLELDYKCAMPKIKAATQGRAAILAH